MVRHLAELIVAIAGELRAKTGAPAVTMADALRLAARRVEDSDPQ